MDALDVDGGFDVHEYRSSMKLLRQDEASMTLANRADLGCPCCQRPFERLFVTEDETVTFGDAPNGPICLARTPAELLVMTH